MGRVTRNQVKRAALYVEVEEDEEENVSPPKRMRGRQKKEATNGTSNGDAQTSKRKNATKVAPEKEVKDEKDEGEEVSEPKRTRTNKNTNQNAIIKDVAIKEEKGEGSVTKAAAKKNSKKIKVESKPVKKEKDEKTKPIEEEEVEEEEEEEAKPIKKEEDEETEDSAPKSSKGKKSSKKSGKDGIKKSAVERAVVKKGVAAVDGSCPIASTYHVHCENNNSDVWDCMLNQTNIQFNNNKYYLIQLLKDDNKEAYSVWMRWGRVGCSGQNSLKSYGSNLTQAQSAFTKKFCDKTRNDWEERDLFEKVPGKYDLLKMDYSEGKDEVDQVQQINSEKTVKEVESKLAAKVNALIKLICDVKAMEAAVVEMKYDAKKAPLGKLTSEQVKAGYAALREIETIIGAEKSSNKSLLEACNAFYTRIPHYFGMRVPPMIRTRMEIQEKMKLLDALGDIQAAMSIINRPADESMNPVDQHYQGLECHIDALDKKDNEYQLLEKYLLTTHGKTHSMYKMELIDIFKVKKTREEDRFKDVGNRMLLWHGSRLTNWAGILSQGLRIAPPEAPSTGYMFGKGIYFADMSSKSANYCMPSYKNKTGLLVVCDVALGTSRELLNADYDAHKLPQGFHSVKGLGRTAPPATNFVTLTDGGVLPMGPGVETKKAGYALQYNEYIVYDVSQVQIKYLFKVQFNF